LTFAMVRGGHFQFSKTRQKLGRVTDNNFYKILGRSADVFDLHERIYMMGLFFLHGGRFRRGSGLRQKLVDDPFGFPKSVNDVSGIKCKVWALLC
jgi:hypothetical protein